MNPDHNEKHREGWDAYWDGKQQEDCPYPVGSSNYVSWTDGWFDALTDDGYTESDNPKYL